MSNSIKIQRIPYEEPHLLELHWTIHGEETASYFELYDNAKILNNLANALSDFPKHSADNYLYQLGSEKPEDNFSYFFSLNIFMRNHRGHDAGMDVRFVNYQEHADTRTVDFRLYTNAPQLRILGELFEKFSKLESEILFWDTHNSFVGSEDEFKSGNWKNINA